MDHGIHRLGRAENLGGLVAPSHPLLPDGPGFVLGAARLQRRPLRQMEHLNRSWWPAVVALKLAGQLTATGLNAGPPRRPAPIKGRVDTDDLPYRSESRIAVGSFPEADAEAIAEMMLQGGVIGLRRRHRRLEQHPPIDRQPLPVEGLHLVRNSDMSMQVRVAGAGVAVGERGGDQAAYVDLTD